ncbi:hypothetical protein BD310DRAFT_935236 [Dichomitus squalens]|uniref:F-box domain-containing protein n=1 Tax=Dichomitus squalens TaxID=114155 RepID=A0A4Q9PKS4_9APHY|nr:hypothetical protein BD310DRAFT_935236 [Dichomitus squalens]
MLRPARGLRPLAFTCRSLRTLCMTVLFDSCLVTIQLPIATSSFISSHVWPSVRSLYLLDVSSEMHALRLLRRRLHFTADPLICGVLDSAFLRRTLQAMPRLHAVHGVLKGAEVMAWVERSLMRFSVRLSYASAPSIDSSSLHGRRPPGTYLSTTYPASRPSYRHI